MNERVKEIRQHFELSQDAFGKKLGVQKSTISKVEKGINSLTDQMALSICREFNINEEWLRTGNGSMFIELTQAERAAKAVASKLKTDNKFILNTFITLGEMSDDEWAVVEKFVDKLAGKNEQKNKG